MSRFFDVVVAGLGMCLLSPLLAILAVAIVIGSGRPIFFRQTRVGLGGRDFVMWKFRTMRVLKGAEAGRFDAGGSPRVTAIGGWLRRTKLDELPQLWNVLRGDMALVGPRPEVRRWVEAYPARWERIHRVRPGITDPASIVFRHEESMLAEAADPEARYREEILPRKLDLYEDYVRSRTMRGDLKILLRTFWSVVAG